MTTERRETITTLIASHGFTVADDGEEWHVCVPHRENGKTRYETHTARTSYDVRRLLGY